MLLNFLGRGSAFNIKEGNNSAFIKINNELILLDCGETVFEKIINNKLLDSAEKVNVFITHMDSDHIGSLSSLIYYCYYMKHIIVDVYFPDEQVFNLLKIQGHVEGQDYNFKYLNIDQNNLIGCINIKPIKVNHIETLKCFGYLIYLKDKLIWYSGDCSEVSNVINQYEIDEFYQDTCLADYEQNVHTPLRLLCEKVPESKRYKVFCMHIDCDELIVKAKSSGFNVVEAKYN